MTRYVLVSLAGGILFAVMDGVIHANPLALRLYQFYHPLARPSLNALAGVAIDLAYGFALAGIFLLLHRALPGATGLAKGLSFALLLWFLRVVMGLVGEWMVLKVPTSTLLYGLITGFGEMLVLGLFFGLTLR